MSDLDSYDIFDKPWLGHDAELIKKLSEERPIHFQKLSIPGQIKEAFVLFRHKDVVACSKQPEKFTSTDGHSLADVHELASLLPTQISEQVMVLQKHMLHSDGERHAAIRKILTPGFSPRAVFSFEAAYEQIIDDVLTRSLGPGGVIEVKTFALAIPLEIIRNFYQVCAAPYAEWVEALLGSWDSLARVEEVLRQMAEYAHTILRMRPPQGGIVAELAKMVDEEKITTEEFIANLSGLIMAGIETTQHAIAHALNLFALFPEQYQLLQQNKTSAEIAAEELFRFVSPTVALRRTAVVDTKIGDYEIPKGSKVVLHYLVANRDRSVFGDNAWSLDLCRNPNPHIAFGVGPHFCLGASLARLELRCFLKAISKKIRAFEVVTAPTFAPSIGANGIQYQLLRAHPF